MAAKNKICVTCGTAYSYCPNCFADRKKPVWMGMFHDENCKNIFQILNQHFFGRISGAEAAEKLKACDLSGPFTPAIQKDLEKLLNTP